jgi:uncharacterized membrane protein YbaN (DUF454 family)
MPHISRRKWRILFGSCLLGLGIAGLGLPVLQGWFFILLGILVLAEEFPFFRRLADRIKRGTSAFAKAEKV